MKRIIVKDIDKIIQEEDGSQQRIDEIIGSLRQGLTYEVTDIDEAYEQELKNFHKNRREAYPTIGEQLDAMYQARNGDDSEIKKIDAIITSVKNKYPKPVKK